MVGRGDLNARQRPEDGGEGGGDAALPPAGSQRALARTGRLGTPASSSGVRSPLMRHLNRLVGSAYTARRVALGRALRAYRDRNPQSQPGQLRRGRAASTAPIALRRRTNQAALVP